MIDIRPMRRDLLILTLWQIVIAVMLFVTVFCATWYIVVPHEYGIAWRVLGMAINIWSSVYGFHVLKRGIRLRSLMRETIATAEQLNRRNQPTP